VCIGPANLDFSYFRPSRSGTGPPNSNGNLAARNGVAALMGITSEIVEKSMAGRKSIRHAINPKAASKGARPAAEPPKILCP
jgi:hypothetical protein